MQLQVADISRMLPEILLIFLAMLVLGSDMFERWGNDERARLERSRSSASLTLLGLGLIFVITLIQSSYIYRLPEDAPANLFTDIIRNLQAGGRIGEPILGAFATDHITMISRLTFIAAAFLTVLLTFDYQPTSNPGEFYTLILISTTGMCLMGAASEFILAFLAIEMTSIPLYVLVGYFLTEKQSSEGGMKYFLFGALSSSILLYGMSLVYGSAAQAAAGKMSANDLTQFARIAELVGHGGTAPTLVFIGIIFIVAGLGYKVAVVPFHSWSPDVYQAAPTPITGFISTASKAAGFVLLYRLLSTTFPGLAADASLESFGGWTAVLALIALVTVVWGNLAALPQMNAKRLLAYSSIAHAGFLILALLAWASPQAIDRELGISSLLYYLIVYTLTNLGAFGTLAVISMSAGSDDISDLDGLAQRNMELAVLFTIFVFSLAGIPPISGFFAKFYVFMAGWQSGPAVRWVVIVAIITTMIGLYYYLRLLKAVFINAPVSNKRIRVPLAMNVTLILAAVLVLALGLFPNLVLSAISQVHLVAGT